MLILLSILWSCCTLMQDGAKDVAMPWQCSAGLRQGAGWLLCSHNWRWHLECAITHILSFLISTSSCNPAAPATIYCWGRLNSSCRLLGLNFITQTHTYAERPHLQMNAEVAKKKIKILFIIKIIIIKTTLCFPAVSLYCAGKGRLLGEGKLGSTG